ncbi:uncharacterized protein LOC129565154 [Sitodiplosis mosellana]|uniref:uncharacterized protein LOC129565154 n=1 Tax=Sitodiplosis mosellana TaxID=263140 RepID=UPI0024440C55|nr:uncharacterized protein LOC129565154 [Sitodiplosis mosellana]
MFMVPGFRQIVIKILGEWFPWPTNRFFGNTFKYLYEQYATNVKTNLKTHCEKRLRKFFKMRCYELNHMCLCGDLELDELFDGDDIKNAINYTYNRRDSTRGNANAIRKLEILLAELYWIGAPHRPDDPHPFNIREFVELNWFQALRMFMNIQRDIHNFHLSFANLRQSWNLFRKYPLYVQQPEFPEPPEITTFTVIPKCTFQRRHVKIDTDALHNILCGIKAMQRTKGTRVLRNGEYQQRWISQTEFKERGGWRLFFNMDEIIKLVKNKKEFGDSIISDGVSASVLFKFPKQSKTVADEDEAETKRKYFAGEFAYALGIDPGMRTFIASVRLDLKTGEETNEKISFKQYHLKSKQDARNIKAERMTRVFTYDEQADLKRIAAEIGQTPSPRNISWRHYIEHRLRMSQDGIAAYSQKNYARLRLDKHIEWRRAIDLIAGKLLHFKTAIINIGAAEISPNCPIRIKKYVRCPGVRKLIAAFKRRGNCVVRLVDEYMTSQHCARCFKRFPIWTKSKRYKKCNDCQPDERVGLPRTIYTNVSKRVLQMQRKIMRTWEEMRDQGDAIAAILTQRNSGRLVSKKQRFFKTWQPNAAENAGTDAAQTRKLLKSLWHRDISAAKLIMYKGLCTLLDIPIHPALLRRPDDDGVPLNP